MDEQERALFRHAMRGVRRLQVDARQQAPRPRPKPRARFARADRHAVLQESLGATSPFEPVDESGDALLFRGDVLHRTHVTPRMTRDRTSIELRFFAADRIPERLRGDQFVTFKWRVLEREAHQVHEC